MKVFPFGESMKRTYSTSIDPFLIMKSTYTHNIVIYIKTYLRSNSTNIDLRGLISYSLFSCAMYTRNGDGKKSLFTQCSCKVGLALKLTNPKVDFK